VYPNLALPSLVSLALELEVELVTGYKGGKEATNQSEVKGETTNQV